MKKLVLILAGALCLSVAAVQAQDPSQQPTKDSTSIAPSQPTPPSPTTPDASTPAYRKDMTQVQTTDVPEGLKQTLSRPQFKGWETGGVYSNADNTVYIVEVKDEVEGRMKAYRFDPTGKPINE